MIFTSFNLLHPPHIPGLILFTFEFITREVKFEQFQKANLSISSIVLGRIIFSAYLHPSNNE